MQEDLQQAIILAAGKGVRLNPITNDTPKCMVKVGGKPILQRLIESLPKSVKKIILVVGYKKEQIMDYFGKEFQGKKVHYVTQVNPQGTGQALQLAKDKAQKRFLVVMGDDLHATSNFEKMLPYEHAILSLRTDPSKLAALKIKDGYLIDIIEKPGRPISEFANTGTYILTPKIFSFKLKKSPRGEYELTDAIKALCQEEKVKVVEADFWMPINSPEQLQKAEEHFKNS